jgi:glycosyltransferase involved in cell wall biosynthesis
MSVFNGARYLREAVNSILDQSHGDFEFLVIDDGSTDGSVAILESHRDRRIRIFRNPSNLGLAASLNRGLDLAEGEYVARMDADDISLKDRLATQVAFMDRNREVGVCGTWIRFFGEREQVIDFPTDPDRIRCGLFFLNVVGHPSVVLRKSFFRRHRLYYDASLKRTQDYDLWVRASRLFPIANIGEVLLHYRMHEEQAAKRHLEDQRRTSRIVWHKQLTDIGIRPTEDEIALHDSVCEMNFPRNEGFAGKAETWFQKIKTANRECPAYPEPMFSRTLDDRLRHVRDVIRRDSEAGGRSGGGLGMLRRFLGFPTR